MNMGSFFLFLFAFSFFDQYENDIYVNCKCFLFESNFQAPKQKDHHTVVKHT